MSKSHLLKISKEDIKPHISINQDRASCGICHRQISRYTCPSCNVPYCSLTCFRSETHTQCSEPFYKRELEDGIKSQPNASMAERAKMMELLKKFEEDGANENGLEDEEDIGDAEEDGLAQRLAGVDLDNMSSEELWARLTPSERSAFLKAIEDPESEGAQALLRSKELESDLSRSSVLPWWETQLTDDEGERGLDDTVDGEQVGRKMKKFGEEPQVVKLPASMLKVPSTGKDAPSLMYNICAVLIAYAYVTRHLAFSPLSAQRSSEDSQVARNLLCSLLPFLTQKDARLVYSSLNEVITNLWAKLVASGNVSKEVFSLLLRDAVLLFQPKRVLEVDSSLDPTSVPTTDGFVDLSQSPSINTLRVLSDLMQLFTSQSKGARKSDTHASLKMRFYAAHVVMTGDLTDNRAFAILAEALKERAGRIEMEGLVEEESTEIRNQ